MRKFLLILLIFIYKNSFSQLNDNFSDGDFTSNPTWTGESSETNFVIEDGQLRSNSDQPNTNFYLSTPNAKALNSTWEFDINLKFSTSGNNYADIYLISNTADLKSTSINGYFVRIGGADDEISLFKRSGSFTSSTKIIDGTNSVVNGSSNNPLRIRVKRTSSGVFSLEYDKSLSGDEYVLENSATDNTYTATSHFGIYIQQSTTSFIRKHFFDNIIIKDIEIDNTPAQLANFVSESNKITLTFNEAINKADAETVSNYILNSGNISPSSVTATGRTVVLNFADTFTEGNHTITINNIKDLSGNTSATITRNFTYTIPVVPSIAKPKEVLINEVLFNPRDDGADFVEVYNNTNKTFDFNHLYLATVNASGVASGLRQISTTPLLFLPNTYWVLTTNPDNIKAEYFTSTPDNFIKLASMPGYSNDKGTVLIVDEDSLRIDQLDYTEKMHFSILKSVDGVSLERSFFDEDTNKPGNFRSAASTVGYATPGFKNSQYLIPIETEEVISFSSKTFSPDNDGFEDVLTINYNINETGYVANVTIYDDNGRLVKKLVSNETISANGNWLWDGINLNSSKAKTGIYIVYAEFFNLNGEVKKYKKTVTLASKFN